MNLKQLEYFRMIAELEHFTKASEKLLISQSSLSHSIKELEAELGVELFMRQGRNVKLTKYGQMFLPFVEQALDTLGEGCQRLRDYVDPNTGTLNIAAPPSLSAFISHMTVLYISETGRTNVNFQISQVDTYDEISRQVLQGEIDLAFSTNIDSPSINRALVGHHEMVLLVSKNHRLANQSSVDLKEIDGERFIHYTTASQIRRVLDAEFERLDIHPQMVSETLQDHVIYGLVAANQGIAIVPRPLGAMPYNVKALPIENAGPDPRKIYLLWNRHSYLPPAAVRFRDFVVQHGSVFDDYLLSMNGQ